MTARVAVVGCGWWSTFAHLPALTRNPAADVVALADPNRANRAAAAAAFGVPAQFDDVEELLDEVPVDQVPRFQDELREHLRTEGSVLKAIRETTDLPDELAEKLRGEIVKFQGSFLIKE